MTRHENPCEPRTATPSAGMSGWLEALTRHLIRHGANCVPSSLSERLEEEWLADLAARGAPLSRLRFALGCCWASRVIAHELAAALRPAASATGPKSVTLYAQPDPSLLSPRAAVFLLILCVHILVIYGLAAGLARRVLEEIPPAIRVSFPEQPANRVQPPPPSPRPEFVHPNVEKIERLITIDTPPDTNAIRDLLPTTPEHPSPPISAGPVKRVVGGPGTGFPTTEDYYPAAARRMEEKGVATVRVCVDETGRLTTDPAIAQSSGSVRLDAGALKLARAGSGHYRPTMEDGRPVSSCYPFRVRFELSD
jgi:periplasmic protein TonB